MKGKLNLPPIGTDVLLITESKETNKRVYVVAKRIKTETWRGVSHLGKPFKHFFRFAEPNGGLVSHVTHWMPLPTIYSDHVEPIRK